MATVNPVVTRVGNHTVEFFYETLTTGNNVGAAIPERYSDFADRTVQVAGTFGAGGNLRIEGSNDNGSNYAALNDPQGNALNVGAAKIEAIIEVPLLMRPNVTAGDGTTDLDVSIICRRPRSGQET
jgi:hypothetical protein